MSTLIRLSLVALAATAAWSLRQSRQARSVANNARKAKPPALQTWEHEGGALPRTGAQMGPDPALP